MTPQPKNKGWLVTFSGTGINLALGILYTWSIFKWAIKESIEQGGQGTFQWEPTLLGRKESREIT